MDEKVVGAQLAYEFLMELSCRKYTEMTFHQLCRRPAWKFRDIYHYSRTLREKYGLEMSKMHNS